MIKKFKIDFLSKHQDLIEEIAQLKLSAFGHMVPDKKLGDFIEGLHQHCNTDQLPITWVALDDRKFVGTFSLRPCDLQSHQHLAPWLGSVVVVPEHRNRGIGAELVKEAENKAKTLGYNFLYLFTPNKAAWYSRFGWDTLELSCLNSTPITIMQKNLTI